MFDNNGMMQVGELTKPLKPDYSQGVFFHHTGKVGRRIRLNDVTLKPTSSSHDVWQVVPELSTKNASGDIDLSVRLKNVMLSDLFLELAKNRTSIFL